MYQCTGILYMWTMKIHCYRTISKIYCVVKKIWKEYVKYAFMGGRNSTPTQTCLRIQWVILERDKKLVISGEEYCGPGHLGKVRFLCYYKCFNCEIFQTEK